jgi:hypothetical protein
MRYAWPTMSHRCCLDCESREKLYRWGISQMDDYCEDLCNDRSLHESADIYLLDIEGGSKYCQFIFHDEYLA